MPEMVVFHTIWHGILVAVGIATSDNYIADMLSRSFANRKATKECDEMIHRYGLEEIEVKREWLHMCDPW